MNSEQDALKQLSRTSLNESTRESSSSVCYNPFCLGDVWHEWGACSYILPSANVQPLTFPTPEQFAFNHFEEELLDVCGLGVDHRPREGVANQRFAPPKSEEELGWSLSLRKPDKIQNIA